MSLISLAVIRGFGFIIYVLFLVREKSLRNGFFAIGWFIYFLGPIVQLFWGNNSNEELLTFYLFSAVLGLFFLLFGLLLYIRKISPGKTLLVTGSFIPVLILLTVFFTDKIGIIASVLQSFYTLCLLILVIFNRNLFIDNRSNISFFWLCFSLFIAIIHAFGFNFFMKSMQLSLRFTVTGGLNLSLLLFQLFLIWEQVQKSFEQSIHDKEILLQEVHHRVKNNLMILSSMLRLHSYNTENEERLAMVESIENRINSMALVHEHLYHCSDFKRINMNDYIHELVQNIESSFDAPLPSIRLNVESDEIYIDFERLMPLGMLLNEVLTNSYKHAFADTEDPEINVSMKKADEGFYVVLVSDNGSGFEFMEEGYDAGSTGLLIIKALADQLEAEISVKNIVGTEYMIIIPKLGKNKKI
ncbi:MAG: sensor histidine kinase [Spirochaetales bacterium]|uniref:histidine kinase n=1 Tax=Candidatus Thalassospirochaeta sargassi TaxID=3119039 RepID=A0AAJ1IAP7_9SPIO|nr:sensor histidine kinase [Spirochaetales bacterium]